MQASQPYSGGAELFQVCFSTYCVGFTMQRDKNTNILKLLLI